MFLSSALFAVVIIVCVLLVALGLDSLRKPANGWQREPRDVIFGTANIAAGLGLLVATVYSLHKMGAF